MNPSPPATLSLSNSSKMYVARGGMPVGPAGAVDAGHGMRSQNAWDVKREGAVVRAAWRWRCAGNGCTRAGFLVLSRIVAQARRRSGIVRRGGHREVDA